MTINDARERLQRSTGIRVAPVPEDPEWFVQARARMAREQQARLEADDHELQSVRWWREHDARARSLGLSVTDRHVPIAVRERQVRRWRAENPDPLSGYYTQRVRSLARTHDIRVLWSPTPLGGAAWSRFGAGVVETPRPTSEELFATALHELGHVLTRKEQHRTIPDPDHPYIDISPLSEVSAWRAAKRLAGSDWTRRMQANLRWALGTYLPHASSAEQLVMRALMQ